MGIILYCIIPIAIAIIISYIAASAFDEIAVSKGYKQKSYFWYCFWLGLAGWLMVVALPDRSTTGVGPAASNQLPKL